MAIVDSEKLDLLWKKIGFGTTKSAKAADKAGSNETIPSPQPVYPESIWGATDLIPAFAPTDDTAEVKVRSGAARIAATTDPTSTPNLTWLATETQGDIDTRLTDFIPPTFGSSYAARVYIGDPAVGPAARLFPDTTNEEWVFDYAAGVLLFASSIPTSKPASIGTGTVDIATSGIYLEAYQYQGLRGIPKSGASDGFELPLGDIVAHGDGSWTPGAVPLDDATPVSEAVDRLNEVLGKLVPSQPPMFPNGALSVANAAGNSPRLATGVTDHAASTLVAGDAVTRITAAGVNSNVFGDVGPGDAGSITASLNGAVVATKVLTGTADNGTTDGLTIADQKDFPAATPGFWKSIDVSLTGFAAQIGVNKARIAHSGAGQTNEVFFVRDAGAGNPTISAGTVVQAAAGTLAYSSGVPHYGDNATLTVGLTLANLVPGETYYGGADPLVISGTNGIISADTLGYAALGITTPMARGDVAAVAITPATVAIDGTNVHNVGVLQATARNVNGATAATTIQAKNILVKRGAAGSRINEMSVPVSGLGSAPNSNAAVRKSLAAGPTPAGAAATWDSTPTPATHEALVVGGVLKHDQTDYSAYLPTGPNMSVGRSGEQYATFSFNRAALSAFKINVTGTYADCRIKLPGASDSAPNAPNGWWNAFKPYDGAGVPGEAGDTDAGCALGSVMTGGTGAFQITFGTQSSTNATGNEILVRFRLNAGQSITALSFTN
ncbi:hypothetical protein MARCHEWKA_00410 [Brevundimonas phage vB_BpoS-Marchewka]|uniref:Uncharacterized protein n=1 Tax=Brevundimonas phage vB_BpoS-Marchewka TaxID=2948604 RepID=A0A9E7N2A3_9CAUD|nr:hypothetical protein MARCHEWKA_00410 [Brevundimonas phage vB_BpoS-Marchewka]